MTTTPAPPLLEARALALRAGGTKTGRLLVDGLGFAVRPGERWVVLGPNGAGKSSLLAALAGVFPLTAGTVSFDGRPLADWSPAALADRRAWGPQFWSDPFPATVLETTLLARDRGAGWRAPTGIAGTVDPPVSHLLDRLDLASLRDVDVRLLSGGERQRVALATVLLQGAPLLLLDEPASHLDLSHQRLLLDLLVEHAERGGAVVASVHDLNLAWDLATHAVLFADGRPIAAPRDTVMTAERLGAAFGVEIGAVAVGATTRFWSGMPAQVGEAMSRIDETTGSVDVAKRAGDAAARAGDTAARSSDAALRAVDKTPRAPDGAVRPDDATRRPGGGAGR